MKHLIRLSMRLALLAILPVLITADAHAATRGLRIKDGSTVLAEVIDGVATGEVAVPPGETSPTLDVFFLDDDLNEVQPAGRNAAYTIADPSFHTLATAGAFAFTVTGITEGSTELTVRLQDGVTTEYTSPAIELHCELEHAEADGLVLRQNGEVIATYWQGVFTGGPIEVAHESLSDSIFVTFLDVDSVEFVPEVAEGFSLVLQMADSTIADPEPAGDWAFRIAGLVEGETELRIGIFHIDHIDFLSQPIEVHVEEEHAEADGYVALRNGLPQFSVWQTEVTGFATAPLGADSDTLEFVFLDVDSVEFVPEVAEGFALEMQIGSPATASATQVGDWGATLHGVSAGSTTLRVGIYHIDHIDFLAVAVPLEVYAGAGVDPDRIAALDLSAPAPNPFRARTSLRFALGRASNVDLGLYDVSGRRLRTVAHGRLPAGSHTATLESSGLDAGVYFARLVTDMGTYTQRVTLSR